MSRELLYFWIGIGTLYGLGMTIGAYRAIRTNRNAQRNYFRCQRILRFKELKSDAKVMKTLISEAYRILNNAHEKH